MTDLKPCPFCGSPARTDLLPHAGGPGWVQCSSCECDQHMSDTLDEAVARWNTRAALASEPVAGTVGDRKSWVVIRDPGCVPDLKGPFLDSQIADFLREVFKHRQQSFVEVVTVHDSGIDVQDGPEALEVIDGRSAPVARAHRKRLSPPAPAGREDLECANCGAKTAFPLCDDCAVSPGVPKPPAATVSPHGDRTTASAPDLSEVTRLLKKISDLAYDEDVGEPLDDAIGYANKALAALATTPAPGAADRAVAFCEWLQGYFKGDLGKDELTAFEANQIRAKLNERFVNGSEVTRADRGAGS